MTSSQFARRCKLHPHTTIVQFLESIAMIFVFDFLMKHNVHTNAYPNLHIC